MSWLVTLFGEGKDLSVMQMCLRALVVFVAGLALIRISGRRSFGQRMPFDNVLAILLGAILSRAVTGASPFLPVLAASATLVALHRLCGWIALYSDKFGRLVKGNSEIIYQNGKLNTDKMKEMLVTQKDLEEGIRVSSNQDSLEKTEAIYIERDGQISVVKKAAGD